MRAAVELAVKLILVIQRHTDALGILLHIQQRIVVKRRRMASRSFAGVSGGCLVLSSTATVAMTNANHAAITHAVATCMSAGCLACCWRACR